ncbi:MAG: hypothetical protein WCT39_05125 [Candidatus Margulisiibacteriota bacterium]
MKPSLVATLLFSFSINCYAEVLTQNIPAGASLTCNAQIRKTDENRPLVVVLNGTGRYSMANDDELPPNIAYLLSDRKISVLTIDKPGISWKDSKIVVDEKQYNQHTQKDLVRCLVNALKWTSMQKGIDKKIYFVGHSEGAQIAVRTYESMLNSNSELAKQVVMLVLSGSPMQSWKTIIEKQLGDNKKEELWRALKNSDNNTIKGIGGVPVAYWRDIFSTEPLADTFKKIARLSPSASFQFFHGLEDENVSVKAVQQLEKWNVAQVIGKKSSLKMSARYYLADHKLNLAAMNDSIMLLLGYMRE